MTTKLKEFAIAILFGAILAAPSATPALAMPPLQCQDYVNYSMDVSKQYIAKSCPATPAMHVVREAHFNWCLSKSEAQVLADRRAKNASLQKCLARPASVAAGGGNVAFCQSYASQLVQIWDQGAARGCPFYVTRKSRNGFDGHFKWCMGKPRPVAEKAISDNRIKANTCR